MVSVELEHPMEIRAYKVFQLVGTVTGRYDIECDGNGDFYRKVAMDQLTIWWHRQRPVSIDDGKAQAGIGSSPAPRRLGADRMVSWQNPTKSRAAPTCTLLRQGSAAQEIQQIPGVARTDYPR
jgi:hypothetical protein